MSRAAQPVKPGDIVTVNHGGWRRKIEILALGTRRGPAAEACLLYREIEAVRLTALEPGWESLFAEEEG